MTTYNLPENVIVHDPDHLAKVRDFADRTNQRKQLEEQLASLPNWFGGKAFVQLYPDFAPYSFYWRLTADRDGYKPQIMNGGLIYHGAHDGGGDGGAPTFSVNLTPANGWRIHT